jgi:hypothetical protein
VRDGVGAGAAQAFTDGIARVAAAPVVLAGVIALVSLYGAPEGIRAAAGALLLWAFLSGGVLDRYARRRPTRARGFFAACGAHFGAMLRLGVIVLLLIGAFHAAIGGDFPNRYVHRAAFVAALLIALVLGAAQVRVAVEDRRSALGAILAGIRFIVRNPAIVVIHALFVAAALGVLLAGERLSAAASGSRWQSGLLIEALIAVESCLALAWLATAISLFQARLAHAGYTAGPPLTWPESPAAEAIASAPPTMTP